MGIKIEQSPKLAVQVIESLKKHAGPIVLNINMPMNAQIGNGVSNNQSSTQSEFSAERGYFNFCDFLESLPTPRLNTLINLAVAEAMKRFPHNDDGTAKWLGVTRRFISYRKELSRKFGCLIHQLPRRGKGNNV